MIQQQSESFVLYAEPQYLVYAVDVWSCYKVKYNLFKGKLSLYFFRTLQ